MKHIKTCTFILISFGLWGCAGNFVSVEQKFKSEQSVFGGKQSGSGFHTVRSGETLYSIAWQYGFDYRELASANSIASPYTIYPKQKLDVSGRKSRRSGASSGSKNVAVAKVPPASGAVAGARKTPPPAKVAPSTPNTIDDSVSYTPPVQAKPIENQWAWPANGRLIAQFSANEPVNKGIDIGGALGDAVYAAMAGTVVYAGKGLRGYGNLVIVKHNDTYLSAYAHANRILVSEQQSVKAGEKIAEIGSTGTDRVKLHFEIRQNGKPVDPLQHLPKRAGG